MLASVAHFDQGHSGTLIINEIALGFLQSRKRQRTGTGREIENSICHIPFLYC
jgi:hypothetical protein